MSKVDPRLRYLQRTQRSVVMDMSDTAGPRVESASGPDRVEILVRLRHESESHQAGVDSLRQAGMKIHSVAPGPYTVVSGTASLEQLAQIEKIADVRRVEASRPLISELDLCLAEVQAQAVHRAAPPIKGSSALIGIIDSGIDYHHPDFRNADGTTRVRFYWDQRAAHNDGNVPYGREYTQAQINAVFDGDVAQAHTPVRDANGHGTHVAGIAAGGGAAQTTHVGVAPAADLIVVALDASDAATLGKSAQAFDAFSYIVEKAKSVGMPVAINCSQGMNGGGHSGETVLETGLDNLARQPGVVIVKSAGNEQQWRIHAGGVLAAGQTREVYLEVRPNNRQDDFIEIWFDDADAISIALRLPGGFTTPFTRQGGQNTFDLPTGNIADVTVAPNAEGTGDTTATVILSPGTGAMIQPGTWALLLKAEQVVKGRYDAWIERTHRANDGAEQSRFEEVSYDPTRTISIPGTARHIITVGSYVTRLSTPPDAPLGALSFFSSRGPTRYGQVKPEIVAPGEMIESAQTGTGTLIAQRGTSMAAPVVTGAAALVLSLRPELTCPQVKQILVKTARPAPVLTPDNAWGYGKVDINAAIKETPKARFPLIARVTVQGATISWETDVDTTGAVSFLPSRRQLLLGKNAQSIADLTVSRHHQLTLPALPPGKYYCEIAAFTPAGYWTEDDNQGRGYEIDIRGTGVVEAFATFEDAAADLTAEVAPRGCELLEYTPIEIPSFSTKGPFIAYASPDSTFSVTKRLLETARRSIFIGIYDFTATYVKDLLLKAMRRGVKVTLMLDVDGRTGETALFEELGRFGAEVVEAPSCANDKVRYFSASHEKVIIIDDEWVLVQSGNYSENSIPFNEEDGPLIRNFLPGNRDMGVAIQSRPLAAFFNYILRRDIKLAQETAAGAPEQSELASLPPLSLFTESPEQVPVQLFASQLFQPKQEVRVTPLLTPDNYLRELPGLILKARQSIYIEQQYIRANQPGVKQLLDAIREACRISPWLDVRIIVAKPFPGRRYQKEAEGIEEIARTLGLQMGEHVRVLNPKHFVHCHNKLLLVDDQFVLISSQNWSDAAITRNREAGVWIEYPELAGYYSTIFKSDWDSALESVPPLGQPGFFGPESLASGKTVNINLGDYLDV